ncbi:MAG: phytoene/squalene synthase family protein [Pseudomonadota bacterium]|nr:phytoene/squalene synthase family protein [Pseudomonadota bacterium]
MSTELKPGAALGPDHAYQTHILQGVSRTFALTIPALPPELCRVVGNAYLLCRVADVVEDDNQLRPTQQRYFSDQFVSVVEGTEAAERFALELYPLLSAATPEPERDLIRNTVRVIRVTHGFNARQRQALARCVRIMAQGMADYQQRESLDGLPDLPALDDYCYYVAGVVGEMLTELFCDYSPEINTQREDLMRLAVSFGQGLQMTNILKDIWEDSKRGACWLPRDLFLARGVTLRDNIPGACDAGFGDGLAQLIGIAKAHLDNALTYTLIIPGHEPGIRKFCLWALGMAILSLRKLNKHRDFSAGSQVKISRRSVKLTVGISNLLVTQDRFLRALMNILTRALPVNNIHEKLDKLNYSAGSHTS